MKNTCRLLGYFGFLVLCLALSPSVHAQVTAQITDAGSQSWNNGSWSVQLVYTPGSSNQTAPFLLAGTTTPVPGQSQSGTLSSTGTLSVNLTINSGIDPVNTQWRFQVCPQASSPCFVNTITITSANQVVTAFLVPPAISINGSTTAGPILAYSDSEIATAPLGFVYFNLTSATNRICGVQTAGVCTWSNSGGGGLPAGVTTPNVTPDEIRRFDGVITNTPPTNFGNSTTATSPAITTTVANDAVINIFDLTSGNFSVNPATGTNIVNVAQAAGQYGMFVNWQTVASAGSVPAVTGTFAASQGWVTGTIALKPSGTIAARTATNAHQSSGATITINVPTGTTNGDFIVACIESFSSSIEVTNSILPPAAFTYRLLAVRDATLSNSVGADKMSCYGRFASSEPASYVFTDNASSNGVSGWMETFTNVLAVDSAPTLTSASASFTSADVGKDICIGSTTANTSGALQSCGTVTSVTSGTVLVCGTCFTGQGSSNEYRYGTDNTTGLQSALNTVGTAGGGTLWLPAGGMMVSGQLILPTTASIVLRGVASSTANWGFQGSGVNSPGQTVNNAKIGTEIDWAATNISGACLIYTGNNNGIISNVFQDTIEDLTLWGGAGTSQDGCGAHGFEAINADRLVLRNVIIGNFIGHGFFVTNASATGYTDGITLDNFWALSNGQSGTFITSNGIAQVQNVYIQNSQFDNNSLFGLEFGGLITGLQLTTNNIQRNGSSTNSTSTELFFDNGGTIKGCSINANFFEADNTVGGGNMYNSATTAQLFCQWSPQNTSATDVNVPNISSGFGTGPGVLQRNDTLPATSIEINVGTGGTATSGVISLPPAPNSWSCQAGNLTAHAGNRADDTVVTAISKTSASVQNQTKSTGAAIAWTASDSILVNCTAF